MRAAAPQPRAGSTPVLRVAGVTVRFGGIVALDGVSFGVESGEIVGLIGPNGAGKTTLLNCLSRLYQPAAGDIVFQGRPLLAVPRHGIAALGIGRTFQNLALFRSMTVLQTVMLGRHSRTRSGFFSSALKLPSVAPEEMETQRRCREILALLGLEAVADLPVMALPFGVQKRLELARALALQPALLLLDEPAGGLNHGEVEALIGLLREIRARFDLTMLLVEHHMGLVMRLSDRVVVLDFGRVIAEGTPADVQVHPGVIRAYLGSPAAGARTP